MQTHTHMMKWLVGTAALVTCLGVDIKAQNQQNVPPECDPCYCWSRPSCPNATFVYDDLYMYKYNYEEGEVETAVFCLGEKLYVQPRSSRTLPDPVIVHFYKDNATGNCPPGTVTNSYDASVIEVITNWWVVTGPGTYSLASTNNEMYWNCEFRPTNCGSGTITFNTDWAVHNPCSYFCDGYTNRCNFQRTSISSNFTVVQVRMTADNPDIDVLCKGCSLTLNAEVCPSGRPLHWYIAYDDTGGASIAPSSGTSTTLSVPETAANGHVVITVVDLLPDGRFNCSDTRSVRVWGPQGFPPRRTSGPFAGKTEAEVDWIYNHPWCAAKIVNVEAVAFAERNRLFPDPACANEPNVGNAFLHAYLMCLVAQSCDTQTAAELGDAHEAYSPGNDCRAGAALMDFHNNQIGIQAAALGGDCSQHVLDALRNGQGRWITPPIGPLDCTYQFQSNGGTNNNCMPNP
jgi:hypothetical protein